MNGIWGSLERQVFDNARVRTLPPSSAAALLPPESNRLTGAASRPAAARRSYYVAAAPPAPPAPPPARAGGPSALGVPVPTDVTGIVGCAAAGFLTAAVVTRADAERRRALAYASRAPRGSREPPSRRAAGRRTASPIAAAFDAVAGAVASAFRGSERADFDARGSYDGGEDEQQQQYGFYDERGYFHQAPPPFPFPPRPFPPLPPEPPPPLSPPLAPPEPFAAPFCAPGPFCAPESCAISSFMSVQVADFSSAYSFFTRSSSRCRRYSSTRP